MHVSANTVTEGNDTNCGKVPAVYTNGINSGIYDAGVKPTQCLVLNIGFGSRCVI
jgi:hypothetical protein